MSTFPRTSIEVIADALGGTYTARGDAVAVIEALRQAGFTIMRPVTAAEEAADHA